MSTYIFRRLLQGIPTFFGVTIIAFLVMLAAPGDPIELITFNPSRADSSATETLRRKLGLDQPPLVQYVYWLVGNDWAQVDSDGDGEVDSFSLDGLFGLGDLFGLDLGSPAPLHAGGQA
jgi:peptide/nickel transport system permease protein